MNLFRLMSDDTLTPKRSTSCLIEMETVRNKSRVYCTNIPACYGMTDVLGVAFCCEAQFVCTRLMLLNYIHLRKEKSLPLCK